MRTKKLWRGWSVGVALATAMLPAWLCADEPTKVEQVEIVVNDEQGNVLRTQNLTLTADQAVVAVSDHWIGVQLEPLTETLKAQLNLEHGLIAAQVFPDSPAAKAGLKEHDILLKAGDAAIKDAHAILKIVGDNKDKEISLTVLRGGKETTIKVTPAKRPAEIHVAGRAAPLASEKWEQLVPGDVGRQIHEALRSLHQGEAGEKRALGMYFVHPGVVGDAAKTMAFKLHGQLKMPDNVSININKDGDKPAKITVKRESKTYEVTEDKIDELPEDLRGPVKQMLNKQDVRIRMVPPPTAAPGAPGATWWNPAPHAAAIAIAPHPAATPYTNTLPRVQAMHVETGGHVEQKLDTILQKLDQLSHQKLDELQREVKQLRAELDELRKKRGAK